MACASYSAPGISQGLGAPNQHSFYGKKLPLWKKKNPGWWCQTKCAGAIPVQRQGGKGPLHKKSAHIQLQGPLEIQLVGILPAPELQRRSSSS